jgi:hypothetical protein
MLIGFFAVLLIVISYPTIIIFLKSYIQFANSHTERTFQRAIIRVFNETHSIPQPILISHPHTSLRTWIHFWSHHDHVTTTPEQNHIYVHIYNQVLAIVSSLINMI